MMMLKKLLLRTDNCSKDKAFLILFIIAFIVLYMKTYFFTRCTPGAQGELHSRYQVHRVGLQTAGHNTGKSVGRGQSGETSPMLTLFTSMKAHPSLEKIHNNTLYNWAALGHGVLPLLYTETKHSHLALQAKDRGWQVRVVPHTNQGIPVFKSMFLDAISSYDTPYYAFANGDILFEESLLRTLKALTEMGINNENYRWTGSSDSVHANMTYRQLEARSATGGLLFVGQRTNVNFTHLGDPGNFSYLKDFTAKHGQLFITNAQDFFITTAQGIPWQHVPDFVIGRPGYDNWMVAKALDWKMMVVDTSEAILAVHQTGPHGNKAGWSTADGTLCINRYLAGNFDYRPGHTKCCHWALQQNIMAEVRLSKRPIINNDCLRIGKPNRSSICKTL